MDSLKKNNLKFYLKTLYTDKNLSIDKNSVDLRSQFD